MVSTHARRVMSRKCVVTADTDRNVGQQPAPQVCDHFIFQQVSDSAVLPSQTQRVGLAALEDDEMREVDREMREVDRAWRYGFTASGKFRALADSSSDDDDDD